MKREKKKVEVRCSVPDESATPEKFGHHGGRQFRSPRYMLCGCDAAYCEEHAKINPFLPYEPGKVKKCRKHASIANADKNLGVGSLSSSKDAIDIAQEQLAKYDARKAEP